MNDKTKQALELASEELQFFHIAGLARLQTLEAITAIREALAEQFCDNHCTWLDHHPKCDKAEQPAQQQEPVAWADPQDLARKGHDLWVANEQVDKHTQPLYTSPPASKPWIGLTDEELQKILQEVSGQGWKPMLEGIEAKLREKNA